MNSNNDFVYSNTNSNYSSNSNNNSNNGQYHLQLTFENEANLLKNDKKELKYILY